MLIKYLDVLSQTLAAELMSSLQTTRVLSQEARGTVAVKTVKGRRYVYIQKMVNGKYEYSYLGPESAVDLEKVKNALKMKKEVLASERQKQEKIVKLLVKSGVVTVPGELEKLLKVFEKRRVLEKVTLIGTLAFLSYQTVLGFVPILAHRTQDVDLVRDETLAIASSESIPITKILEEEEIGYFLESPPRVSFPVRIRLDSGIVIDFLCPKRGDSDFSPPGNIGFTDVGAQKLPYLWPAVEDVVSGALLGYNSAFSVIVPHPLSFVVMKAVAFLRRGEDALKKEKDQYQAKAVLMALTKTQGAEEVFSGIENRIDFLKANRRFKAIVKKAVGSWIEEIDSTYRENEINKLHRRRKRISRRNT